MIHTEELHDKVINKLMAYEGMTWDTIIKANGGRSNGNNNHFENVADLVYEAQERWKELRLEEYDQVFSLRLTGRQRLYGLLEDGVYTIIWYDQEHEIYPTGKK